MCNMSNEVPQLFDWDQARNQPGDRWARDELNNATVEFVAPTEYMVRAPQPAVYVILIDVSHTAVQSGTSFAERMCFEWQLMGNGIGRHGGYRDPHDFGELRSHPERRQQNEDRHCLFRCLPLLLLHACASLLSPFSSVNYAE